MDALITSLKLSMREVLVVVTSFVIGYVAGYYGALWTDQLYYSQRYQDLLDDKEGLEASNAELAKDLESAVSELQDVKGETGRLREDTEKQISYEGSRSTIVIGQALSPIPGLKFKIVKYYEVSNEYKILSNAFGEHTITMKEEDVVDFSWRDHDYTVQITSGSGASHTVAIEPRH